MAFHPNFSVPSAEVPDASLHSPIEYIKEDTWVRIHPGITGSCLSVAKILVSTKILNLC